MVKFLICLTVLLMIINTNSKNKINYLDPCPDAKLVNSENTIIIGFEKPVSLTGNKILKSIKVYGERTGLISGTITSSSDKTRILFKPSLPFSVNEKIKVTLSGNFLSYLGKNNELTYSFYTSAGKISIDPLKGFNDETGADNPKSINQELIPVPYFNVTVDNNPSPGHLFLTPFLAPATFVLIYDRHGLLTWSGGQQGQCGDLKKQPNGNLTYFNAVMQKFIELNENYQTVNYYQCGNGYTTNIHELRVLNNGHAYLMAYDPEHVNMSLIIQGGDPNAIVTGLIIQEIDESKNVVFQWRSWDHFLITDATHENLLDNAIDYVHGNSIEIDTDSNLIISARHMDEITKINHVTGSIIWRLGGKNNQFTFNNDPIGFSHQHAVRRLANGNLTLYDNGNYHSPQFSRALEYSIDVANKVVTKVWEYRHNPSVYGSWGGYVQRLEGGNTLIGWGGVNPAVTEVTPDGTTVFEAYFPAGWFSYRAFKYLWLETTPVSQNHTILGVFALQQNYPNPFNPQTKIKYVIYSASFTELTIYDITGRVIAKPVSEYKQQGSYEITFDGTNLASGIYFYKLQSCGDVSIKRMMLIK